MKRNKKLWIYVSVIIFIIVFIPTGCNKDVGTETSGTEISSVSEISDDEILKLFDSAKDMVDSGGLFERSSDGILCASGTNETISQYVERFKTVFTDSYVENYFDLYGYLEEGPDNSWVFRLIIPADKMASYDVAPSFVHFDDICDNTRYDGYDTVCIGGIEKGNDLSFVGNEVVILSHSDNEILITNTVWHCAPESKSEMKYVCHLENGRVIIDGLFGGLDDSGNVIISDATKSGTIMTPQEQYESNYYLKVVYTYSLILEDGQWKFNNFVLWG